MEDDGDMLDGSLNFSPSAVFGGIVTAIWIFMVQRMPRQAMSWELLLKAVKNTQTGGGNFRYMVDDLPGLAGPDIPLGHKIVLRSIPRTGQLIAYVEVLGVLRIGGIFAAASNSPVALEEHIYAYDLLEQQERSREIKIDAKLFERQNWKTVGMGLSVDETPKLRARIQELAEAILVTRYQERSREGEVSENGEVNSN